MSDQTKKFNQLPKIKTLGTTYNLIATNASNGANAQMTAENLKKELGSISIDDVMDNVFIMCHRYETVGGSPNVDNYPTCYRPSEWAAREAKGEVATGVLLIDGGRKLVIAPTEKKSTWSTNTLACGTTQNDRILAQELYNGKENCKKILTNATMAAEGDASAVGWCNAYERVNAGGKGLKSGAWWLPSLGELYLMFANFTKINYALSKISGATPLIRDAYWSCTERSAAGAWYLNFYDGTQVSNSKSGFQYRVRPVSAFAMAT